MGDLFKSRGLITQPILKIKHQGHKGYHQGTQRTFLTPPGKFKIVTLAGIEIIG
jgi:hypothetical protein